MRDRLATVNIGSGRAATGSTEWMDPSPIFAGIRGPQRRMTSHFCRIRLLETRQYWERAQTRCQCSARAPCRVTSRL